MEYASWRAKYAGALRELRAAADQLGAILELPPGEAVTLEDLSAAHDRLDAAWQAVHKVREARPRRD